MTKIMELHFFCPSVNGYVRYPIKKELRRKWHEERIAEKGTHSFTLHFEIYENKEE